MLPGCDGPSLRRAIRAAKLPTAVLLPTPRSQVEDRATGLDSGADDYLVKPFSFEGLLARVRGLGLAIARSMVEAMHGRITISNRPAGGVVAEVILEISR